MQDGSDDNPTVMPHDDNDDRLPPPVVLGPIEMNDASPHDAATAAPLSPAPLPYRRTLRLDSDPSSRELLLGWCLWLLGSWLLLGMGLRGTPIREMVFASMFGMMLLWPAFRLSQDGRWRRWWVPHGEPSEAGSPGVAPTHPEPAPAKRSSLTPPLILRDWFALNAIFQAVIWPHVLTRQWQADQAAWVSAAVASWTLLCGAIVALGCLSLKPSRRLAAMAGAVLLVLGEPLLLAWMNRVGESHGLSGFDWAMHVSPIEAIYALSGPPVDFDPAPWAATLICVTVAALAAWAALLIAKMKRAA
jgi:hypothetical protein